MGRIVCSRRRARCRPAVVGLAGLALLTGYAGMSLGSHGMDHVPWRRLDRPAIDREIFQAKQLLEDTLRTPVDAAACPFGAYDRRALRLLRRRGYDRVYTSDCGPAERDAWLQPRNTIRRGDGPATVERLLAQARAGGQPPLRRLVLTAKRWR